MTINNEEPIIRNFQLMRHIFDNLDILTNEYKLSKSAISVINQLCMKHSTFNAYIECSITEFIISRKSFYRILEKLEELDIIKIAYKPAGRRTSYLVYFTSNFIYHIAEDNFAELYDSWLTHQLDYKERNDV